MVFIFFFHALKKKSCFMHLETSSSSSILPRYIEPLFSTFCLLDTSVDLSKSSSTHPSIPPDRLNSSCMHFIYFWVLHFFYSLYVHSILLSSSSCSLYVSFMFVSDQFFGFLCPLTIVSKRTRNLRFECHSLGGVIDLGGKLHVKGKKIFWCN